MLWTIIINVQTDRDKKKCGGCEKEECLSNTLVLCIIRLTRLSTSFSVKALMNCKVKGINGLGLYN